MTDGPGVTGEGVTGEDAMGEGAAGLEAYVAVFEGLRPDRLDTLRDVCADDVRFIDPFNDVRGIDALIGVFRHMYKTLDEAAFEVTDRAVGQDASYLRWTMTARKKGSAEGFQIVGMSEVHFDGSGKATLHVDHWDTAAQLYNRVPILGWILGRLRRLLAAPSV